MKKLIILLCFIPVMGFAQNQLNKADDSQRIALDVLIPDQVTNIPDYARSLLESKITQAVTDNGMGGAGVSPRFCITAKMETLTKDITPTTPVMQAYTFEVYLYLVDFVDQNILSTVSFPAKGAGTNDNKAYTNALSSINLRNKNIKKFLDEGKQKIIEYYNTRCDYVLLRAQSLADQKQFGDALATLSGVPEVCMDCYTRCLNAIGPIYQKFIDHDCQILIAVGSAVWAAQPNSDGALEAGSVLCEIDPDSKCYGQAQGIIKQMGEKVIKDEQRDWNFMIKVWNDNVKLEALRIRAFRDVGVAYGENQRPTYNNILWVFR
jgi:hypothetical protein